MDHQTETQTDGGALTLYWLQSGGCGGDTWSLFNSELPHLAEFFEVLNIEVLWHASISNIGVADRQLLHEAILSGKRKLDILCVEGSVIRGPSGTGMFDTLFGRPKKDLLAALAKKARYVLAVGTCSSFGGVGADGEIEATGLQFHKWDSGGFLGKKFRSGSGMPVINLPGCPCHPGVVTGAIQTVISEGALDLTPYNMPLEWYGTMVHQGCTRPDFPQQYPFFKTRNIEGIPIELPDGVNRAHYMAYKGIAAAAAPQRLKLRKTGI